MHRAGLVLSLLAVLVCSTAARGQYYVDAVDGSNANSGLGPDEAFRTVTRAFEELWLPATVIIRVAPGTYDQALGERFPWSITQLDIRVSLLGAGADRTYVEPPSGTEALLVASGLHPAGALHVSGFEASPTTVSGDWAPCGSWRPARRSPACS